MQTAHIFKLSSFCRLEYSITEDYTRKSIFNILINSKIKKRLDHSDGFWYLFNVLDKNLKNQVGLYKIETIANQNMITTDINCDESEKNF